MNTMRFRVKVRMVGKFAVALVAAGGSLACGTAGSDDVGASSEDVASINQSLTYTSHSWNQGSLPTPMGSTTNRVCFLSAIRGKFAGSGEWVHARINGAQWELTGASQQTGVGADAVCITRAPGATPVTYTPTEFRWSQGQAEPTHMILWEEGACFLTRVGGKLAGSGEKIRTRTIGSDWYLDGTSQQTGVHGRARCVYDVNVDIEKSWHVSQGSPSITLLKVTNTQSATVCPFVRVQGAFQGGGEKVESRFYSTAPPFSPGAGWYLHGVSQQAGTGVGARCIL